MPNKLKKSVFVSSRKLLLKRKESRKKRSVSLNVKKKRSASEKRQKRHKSSDYSRKERNNYVNRV